VTLAVLVAVVWWAWPVARPATPVGQAGAPVVYSYRVVNRYPHDAGAFTQGLVFRDGFLYESTGLNGQSSLRKVVLETGAVIRRHDVPSQYFAEGLTDWGGTLIQLTWQARVGFVYDLETFALTDRFPVAGEGWGLTHDGTRLIMSDGSSMLRFLDPETRAVTGTLEVRDGGTPITSLNELEWVSGEIFANVWQQDRIARIDPTTGRVVGWVDLRGLRSSAGATSVDAVLNGIAFDASAGRLFVTGKLWPTLFEIALVERKPGQ